MQILLESFILSCAPTNDGNFISCGRTTTTDDELLQFFKREGATLVLYNITQDQHVVIIERANPVSHVVTERNICECPNVGEAMLFQDLVMAIAHRQDWDRNKDSVLAWVNGEADLASHMETWTAARSDVGDENLDDGPMTRLLYLIERGETSAEDAAAADQAFDAETHGDEEPRDLVRQYTDKQTRGN